MERSRRKGFGSLALAVMLLILISCKKDQNTETAKVKPPVRTYVVTARADKKGTNSNSAGTAMLKGQYDEETKMLSYSIEYTDIVPQIITMRYGPKGSAGTLVKELYNNRNGRITVIQGGFELTPLQERNLLKGLWFVAVTTSTMSPEISGVLTYKQQ